jgi:D-serine deaminase-like pyridoxal phosphate-dependent protein
MMNIDQLDTPSIWVDLEVMERNLARMAEYTLSHGLALRPHIKTHKTPELALRQLQSGAVGITSAKVTEAEVMAAAGLDDILLAYPLWGEQKWRRLKVLASRASVTVATDSEEQAGAMARALGEDSKKISLLVEVDLGFSRTGLALDESLAGKVARIAEAGIPVRGMMFFPGQIGKTDEQIMSELNKKLAIALSAFRKAGVPLDVVSGGSTPTAFYSHFLDGLTEIRPGTYIFNDCNTVARGPFTWNDCALKVRCRVVSISVPGGAIIDGGSKTFSDAQGIAQKGFGRLVQCPEVLCEKMNEEHGYLKPGDAPITLRVGDLVDVIPNHVCTTVNMHHVLYGVRQGVVEEVWSIAAHGKIH